MVDPNTRQGKRAPVTLKIKFKSATLEQFIERYAVDVSHGGIFIRTKDPLPVGTQMKFEFQLRDATPLITGEATVVWTRENDPARPGVAPGMGVRFDKLGDGSQAVLDKILAEKAKGGDRPPSDTKPPVFNEAPTKVAPSPLVGALANESKPRVGNMAPPRSGFMDERTDTTPLPKPMPFHSDADEFPDEAFEEATKVRSMEELVAATKDIVAPKAKAEKPAPAPVIEKPVEKPAPVPVIEKPAPAPVAVEKPAPVIEKPVAAVAEAVPSVKDELAERRAAKSEPTVAEPVKPAEAKAEPAPRISEPRILDHQKPKRADTQPVAKRQETAKPVATATPAPVKPPQPSGGGAPIALILLLVAAVAGAGVWFFVLRKPSTPDAGSGTASAGSGSGSAPDVGSGSGSAGSAGSGVASGSGSAGSGVASGSAGSGSAGSGSAGSGSAGVVAADIADIKITSVIAGAQIDIPEAGVVGEPLPYTAKLDKGKTFKARVSAPGYLGTDVDLVGGGKPVDVKLKAMPHVVHVTSKPAGALIFVDGAPTRRTTPGDVELTAAQAKKGVRIELRKAGFDRYTAPVDIAGFTEKDNTMTTEMVATLVAAKPPAGGGGGGGGGGNTNPGSGSATPGSGSSGSGSATPGSGSTGSGSATPGSGSTGSGSATPGSGSATPGSAGSGSAKPGSGSATPGSGSAKPGSGSGSTGAGSGAGSSAGSGSGSSEPTPDWMK